MPLVRFTQIKPGLHYACHPDHRNGNGNKSQWTIIKTDEIACFMHAHAQAWVDGRRAFGIFPLGNPNYLGLAKERHRRLFLARFDDGNGNQHWHGYPADPQKKTGDRLPEQIKEALIRTSVLPPAKVRKLQRGEPCRL